MDVYLHVPHMVSKHAAKLRGKIYLYLTSFDRLLHRQTKNKQANKHTTNNKEAYVGVGSGISRSCFFMRHPTLSSTTHSPFQQQFYSNYHSKAWFRTNLLYRTNPLQAIHYEHMRRHSKQHTQKKLQVIVTREYYVKKTLYNSSRKLISEQDFRAEQPKFSFYTEIFYGIPGQCSAFSGSQNKH